MPLLRQLPVRLDDLLLISVPGDRKHRWFVFIKRVVQSIAIPKKKKELDKTAEWIQMEASPANSQDLVVIPFTGDFEQLLCSFQTLSDGVVVAVELPRLLVVFNS